MPDEIEHIKNKYIDMPAKVALVRPSLMTSKANPISLFSRMISMLLPLTQVACKEVLALGILNFCATTPAISRPQEGRFRRRENAKLCPSVIARSEETKQSMSPHAALWIVSRNLSSGAHSRDPLARNDAEKGRLHPP